MISPRDRDVASQFCLLVPLVPGPSPEDPPDQITAGPCTIRVEDDLYVVEVPVLTHATRDQPEDVDIMAEVGTTTTLIAALLLAARTHLEDHLDNILESILYE